MIIEAEGLTKKYGAQIAVNNLTLQIREGEVFGFLGPNGAGKTTTLLMFLGLTEPASGKVRVIGFDPAREPLRVKEKVGYLPENVGFYDDMDARQNLRFIARLNRISDGISEVLIKEPKLIFLDEPTIGLDPDGTNRMLDLIHSLSRDRNITIFLSSHLLDQVQRICDRVGIMIKGNLVAIGPIQELAKKKLGVEKEHYTLEELYMKYFKEA